MSILLYFGHTLQIIFIFSSKMLQNLFEGGLLPAPFDNVSHLQLDLGNFSNELVPRVVLLFRGMRNLSTLYIKTDQVEYYLLKAAVSKSLHFPALSKYIFQFISFGF